ncbi:MAG: SpoIIE family protein phosphatase [Bacteroidales bacterium]|nr:SpoIIE family protein phosphatase [Bacteroidales bacterium]
MVKFLIISILAFIFTNNATGKNVVVPSSVAARHDSIAPSTDKNDPLQEYLDKINNTGNSDTTLKYALILEKEAAKKKDTTKWLQAYHHISKATYNQSKYNSAKTYFNQMYDLAEQANDTSMMANALLGLGNTFYMTNETRSSLQNYQKALVFFKAIHDSTNISRIYRNIGTECANLRLITAAEQNIKFATAIDRAIKDSFSLAEDICILVDAKIRLAKNTKDDLPLLTELEASLDSVPIFLSAIKGNNINIQNEYFEYYRLKAEIQTYLYRIDRQSWRILAAFEFLNKALQIAKDNNDTDNIALTMIDKAKISYYSRDYKAAVDITDQLKQHVTDTMWAANKMDIYHIASQANAAMQEYEQAYNDLRQYNIYRDEYMNDSSLMQSVEFASNVKIAELKSEQETINTHNEEIMDRQRVINILSITIIIIGGIALILIIRAFLRKRSNVNELQSKNEQLKFQQEEIMTQRNTIEEQRQASERANLIMFQSIRYARHIQNAALPSEDHIRRIFPDHFVYYEPKDIVSGDFYYATQNAGLDIFVLGDCTGHGVPGGFLSMLGISAIKELLRNPEIDIMPGIILDMMREYVKQALSNDEEVAEAIARGEESFSTADGMDMSIVAYDKYNHKLRFAGAYQNLYIARNGEVKRLRGDRMPVGRHINESSTFNTIIEDTKKGDMIYMSSDGIPSQIGFSGVKFMSKRLIEFFKSNYALPCEVQKRNITNIINDWLFGAIQIDDLSLVGIRITE